jgi:murein DD-endopeptidase MepM/ murein hydrolase activator NlpD
MRQKTLIRPLGVLLVIALILALAAAPPVAASGTSDSLAAAKSRQDELDKKIDKLQAETAQMNKSLNKLDGQLEWLNNRSEEQKKLYQQKTEQLQAAMQDMADAYANYAASIENLQAKQQQYVERMRTMFDHKERSLLEVFIEADSLQGFFTTLQFMNIVADTDKQMLDELGEARDQAELSRTVAEAKSAELSAVVDELEADLAKLKADKNATEADMRVLEQKLSAQAAAEDELNQESEKVATEVAGLQKQLAAERATEAAKATAAAKATRDAQRAPTPTPGAAYSSKDGWVWPYPADHTVYSGYGTRLHPIYHVYRFHSGVDLGGTYGAPIVAAHDGTVLLVRNSWEGRNTGGSGYGNYIVIDHGDGYSTLYGHLKDTLVKVGQQVKAGDKIATCGSTGTSTGPHLHFEVMIDGHTVNPLDFVR